MRVKPTSRTRLYPIATGLILPEGSKKTLLEKHTDKPAKNTNQVDFKPDSSLSQLVEKRVRGSLQLVKRGEATPQQALTAVVKKLAEDLSETQFQSLVNYFKPEAATSGSGSTEIARDCTVVEQPCRGVLQAVMPPVQTLHPARPWFAQNCMLGIDEAGRGPVLGPMVYAAVVAPIQYKDTLKTKSYADSKTLSEAARSRLFAALSSDNNCVYVADVVSAEFISGQMLGRAKVSLNAVAEHSTLGLIQAMLDAGVALTEVYVDTVGDPDRYRERLSRHFPGLAFTVCPKADALYPVVSAASIVAKVLRDTALRVRRGDLGNGYPSDPLTQAWLTTHCDPVFGFPGRLVRFSWETCTRILDERCVKVSWGDEEQQAASGGASQQKLTCFKRADDNSSESSGMGRHPYFRLRRLQRVAAF
eukprot:gene12168-12306_t